jgi:hypothetical protein
MRAICNTLLYFLLVYTTQAGYRLIGSVGRKLPTISDGLVWVSEVFRYKKEGEVHVVVVAFDGK